MPVSLPSRNKLSKIPLMWYLLGITTLDKKTSTVHRLSWQHWSESCSFFVIFWLSGFLGYQKACPAPLVDPQTFTNCFDPVGFLWFFCCCFQPFSSVQFSCSVVSDSLRPHESQHARPPCPSPTPTVYSNSCPSSRWCHPAISSSVLPFSSCPQSLPASGSFPVSQLFTWGGQSIGVSASASVLPVNTRTDLL